MLLDLSTVSAILSEVSHVNAQCEPAAITSAPDTTNARAEFASLTSLTPAVNKSVDLVEEVEVHAGGSRSGVVRYSLRPRQESHCAERV